LIVDIADLLQYGPPPADGVQELVIRPVRAVRMQALVVPLLVAPGTGRIPDALRVAAVARVLVLPRAPDTQLATAAYLV
jgi:hypothetical protein